MKRYNSVEELLNGCASSALKSHVSSVLENNQYIAWDLVSCSENGDVIRSEFTSPIESSDLAFHLSCEINAKGEHAQITTRVPGQPGV